jgi:hypothetical protein
LISGCLNGYPLEIDAIQYAALGSTWVCLIHEWSSTKLFRVFKKFVLFSIIFHVANPSWLEAPEILRPEPYTHSVDWWSLGILFYALLQGKVKEFHFTSNISHSCLRIIRFENIHRRFGWEFVRYP